MVRVHALSLHSTAFGATQVVDRLLDRLSLLSSFSCSQNHASILKLIYTTLLIIDKDHPDRAKHIDHHKSDSVEKAKTGKGEWKPELASSSEQAISGDKNDMTIEQMQKLGSKKAEEDKSPSGSESSKGASSN